MFDNIGEKIKALAMVVCWVGIACSVACGVIVAIGVGGIGVLLFLLIAVLGSFACWVGSLLFYGFGELVTNSAIIAENSKLSKKSKPVKEVKKVNAVAEDSTLNIIDEEDELKAFLKQLFEDEKISQSDYDNKLDELNFMEFQYSKGYISENEYFEKRKVFIGKLEKRG